MDKSNQPRLPFKFLVINCQPPLSRQRGQNEWTLINGLSAFDSGVQIAKTEGGDDVTTKERYHGGMPTETISKKLFTVDEFVTMSEAGVFPEEGRLELIRGEIFEMPPTGAPHAGRVDRLNHLLVARLGDDFIVSVQNPVVLDEYSQPMPDLKILKFRPDFYTTRHPGPNDILLAIEVSSTSIAYDSRVKAPLYAEAKIPEYWLIDVARDVLIVRTDPVDGEYAKVVEFRRGDSITPQRLPECSFLVDEILGQFGQEAGN